MTDRVLRSATKQVTKTIINFKAPKARSSQKSADADGEVSNPEPATTQPAASKQADDEMKPGPGTRKRKLSAQISEKVEGPTVTKAVKVESKKTPKEKDDPVSLTPSKKEKPTKKKPVSLAQSPFPTYAHPTEDECQVVYDLLTKAHGPAIRPSEISNPSETISGCGEVPSVFDSLMRTLLSANTTAANSNRALQGLLKKYGKNDEGSVNWEAVRVAPKAQIEEAIRSGGLADIKSKRILEIANQVYEEGKETGNGFSLDYLHKATDPEIMEKLMSFNGIGVKTASCVLMFCLQRNLFPVDTHVFRISQLLGWVPTPASMREEDEAAEAQGDDAEKKKKKKRVPVTRDSTFLHLNAVIPNELKYGLHQLFIRHGRYCPTCNGKAGRAHGLGTHGRPLEKVTKEVVIKEEAEDGTFQEVKKTVIVKEEVPEEDEDGSGGVALPFDLNSIPIKGEEVDQKPYLPVDAAGGTGEKTGGNDDGSCILGDLISWERLRLGLSDSKGDTQN